METAHPAEDTNLEDKIKACLCPGKLGQESSKFISSPWRDTSCSRRSSKQCGMNSMRNQRASQPHLLSTLSAPAAPLQCVRRRITITKQVPHITISPGESEEKRRERGGHKKGKETEENLPEVKRHPWLRFPLFWEATASPHTRKTHQTQVFPQEVHTTS